MSDSTSHPSQDEVSSQPRTEGQVPLRFPETVMIRMMHKNNSGGHVQNQSSEQSRSASISSANNPSPLKRVTNVSDLVRPTSRAGSDEEMDSVREPSAAVAESSESEKPVQRLRWRPSGDLMDRDDGEAFDLDDESSDAGSLNFDEMPSAVNTARLRQEAEPSYISARDFGPAEQPAEPPLADLPEGSVKKEVKGKDASSRAQETKASQHSIGQTKKEVAGPPHESPAHPSRNPLRKTAELRPSDPLPFAKEVAQYEKEAGQKSLVPTVEHRTPPTRTRPRIFGLEECLTYFPTMEEFADPMKYIEYISSPDGGNAKEYGIVKIVPPEGWKMDFVLDQETFRFKTRVQRLNSLSADARASLNYQDQLEQFHLQQYNLRQINTPVIEGRAMDLYSLKLVVSRLGGGENITKNKLWNEVAKQIGYSEDTARQIRAAYRRIVAPFEEFNLYAKQLAKRDREDASSGEGSSDAPPRPALQAPTWPGAAQALSPAALAAPKSDISRENTPSSVRGDDEKSERRSSRKSKADSASWRDPVPVTERNGQEHGKTAKLINLPGYEEQLCEICLSGDHGVDMLICDGCDRGYHSFCLNPRITSIPKTDWFCPPCLLGSGHDYGFEEGDTHSLSSFWNRSEAFRKHWWQTHRENIWNGLSGDEGSPHYESPDGDAVPRLPNGLVRPVPGTDLRPSEDDVEREFWRLVHSPHENVDIEYGADIHSTTHGSASPNIETHPYNPYSRDPWNLNSLPILPASLLKYINSDISGMTVPWIYVGMMFSAFCWHNEDHYTYSINYQHFGHAKTWYGVPGADAEKLEAAMKNAAPDLFEATPDLMFQLTTLMSPGRLKKEGVRVYACDQRANEFVITYPKAYHAGFNQGFNVNEAVNFALPDWMHFSLECARKYQRFSKQPVFSHDRLIFNVAHHNHGLQTALWLHNPMREMLIREFRRRKQIRTRVPNLREKLAEFDKPEEEYQCKHCNVFCFLAQVTCELPGNTDVACLEHAFIVFENVPTSRWIMRLRTTDESLKSMLSKLIERASVPSNWRRRLTSLLVQNKRPPLKTLRALVLEGERITTPLKEIEQLRKFVEQANDWVEQASKFISRKGRRIEGVTGSRGRKSRTETSAAADARTSPSSVDEGSNDMRSPDALMRLLADSDVMPFDAPEINSLRQIVVQVDDIQKRAEDMLRRIEKGEEISMELCHSVIESGSEVNVQIEAVDKLEKHIRRRKWFEEMDTIHTQAIDKADVYDLLREAAEYDVPPDHPHVRNLQNRVQLGREWENKAKRILKESDKIDLDDLRELLDTPDHVPVTEDLQAEAQSLLRKGNEIEKAGEKLMEPPEKPGGDKDNRGDKFDIRNETRANMEKRLNEGRRILRLANSSNLTMAKLNPITHGLQECTDWLQSLTDILNAAFHAQRPESVAQCSATIRVFCAQIETTAATDDEKSPTTSSPEKTRYCVCRSKQAPDINSTDGIQCHICRTLYHQPCIKVGSKNKNLGNEWACHVCDPAKLRELLPHRRAVKLADVAELVDSRWFQRRPDKMPLPPPEFKALRYAVTRAERLRKYVAQFLAGPVMPSVLEDRVALQHLLRKALACPLNIALDDQHTIVEGISMMLHGKELLEEIADPAPPATADQDGDASVDTRKRRRGKRAKLSFREEEGLLKNPPKEGGTYCICHGSDGGTMINCDRCAMWFHNACMKLPEQVAFGEEKYLCAMCSCKMDKKYMFAEIRVRSIGDPDEGEDFIDLRSTLRSETVPVVKTIPWTVEEDKRILLHLTNFSPAVRVDSSNEPPKKRARKSAGGSSVTPAPATDEVAPVDAEPIGSTDSAPLPSAAPANDHSNTGIAAPSSVAPSARTLETVAMVPQPESAPAPIHQPVATAPRFPPGVTQPRETQGTLARTSSPSLIRPVSTPRPSATLPSPNAFVKPEPRSTSVGSTASKAGSPLPLPSGSAASSSTIQSRSSLLDVKPFVSGSSAAGGLKSSDERHQAGMANLYARGVTDEMISKWFIGWDGRTLVYPRYGQNGKLGQIELGPSIKLAPHDRDGSLYMTEILARANAQTRVQQESNSSSRQTVKGLLGPFAAAANKTPGRSPSSTLPSLGTTSLPPPIAAAPSPALSAYAFDTQQARDLAKRMRPGASDSELDRMVESFMRGD